MGGQSVSKRQRRHVDLNVLSDGSFASVLDTPPAEKDTPRAPNAGGACYDVRVALSEEKARAPPAPPRWE